MGPRTGVAVLFTILTLLFVVIGSAVGYFFYGSPIAGAIIFLVISAVFNLISYFFAGKLVLRANRARLVTEAEQPKLYSIVREVSSSFGQPMPKVAVSDVATPNAFATGRNPKNAIVCATRGILQILDDSELRGVIAHEMAHVKDRDILVMSIAATIAGAISWAANSLIFASIFGGGRNNNSGFIGLILMAVTVPIAAMMLQLAISRRRESEADIVGARTIGDPLSLASALRKLETANVRSPIRTSPASSSLYIVNPGRKGSMLMRLMSTHPPIEVRIEKLQKLALDMGFWSPGAQGMAAGQRAAYARR
jgi:heat shock protein HtpX